MPSFGHGIGCFGAGHVQRAGGPQSSGLQSRPSPFWSRYLRPCGKHPHSVLCGICGDRHNEEQTIGPRSGWHDLGRALLLHTVTAGRTDSAWPDGLTWRCLQRCRFAADIGRISNSDGVRAMATEATKVVLESTLTCPSCGHVETETMPTDACQWFYECKSCRTVLKPLEGDCCVYCSYATVPCPPIQEGKSCCA